MCGSLDAPGSSICPCRQSVNTCTLFVILFIIIITFFFFYMCDYAMFTSRACFFCRPLRSSLFPSRLWFPPSCRCVCRWPSPYVVVSGAGPRPTSVCLSLALALRHAACCCSSVSHTFPPVTTQPQSQLFQPAVFRHVQFAAGGGRCCAGAAWRPVW